MLNYVLLFFIYSLWGWIVEVLHVGLISEKKFYNRGFLNLPIIPIYGFGSLFIITIFKYISLNIVANFIIIIILTSSLEYLTSLIMENLFHLKWWDYSKYKYQIHGRVCLRNSILFGIGGLLILKVNPLVLVGINQIDEQFLKKIDFILFLLFFIDLYKVLANLTKLEIRDIKLFSTNLSFKQIKKHHQVIKTNKFKQRNMSKFIVDVNLKISISIFILLYLVSKYLVLSIFIAIISLLIQYIVINMLKKRKYYK